MLIYIAALSVSTDTPFVLDARRDRLPCSSAMTDGMVGCAEGTLPGTRLPARVNGREATVLIEPSGPISMECNADFIRRSGTFGSYRALGQVGPVDIRGGAGHTAAAIAGRRSAGGIRWTNMSFVKGADCVAGTRSVGHDIVRFALGPPRADAVETTMRFHVPALGRAYGRLDIGRTTLAIRFELDHARTVLTASAARAIAPELGGTAHGPILKEPIAYGIERPIRRLALHRPFRIGRMALRDPFVRGADYGNATNIRTLRPEEAEPEDIRAAAGRERAGSIRLVRVGADDLSQCVSLTVDHRRQVFTLLC